jgi:hypothetical protein
MRSHTADHALTIPATGNCSAGVNGRPHAPTASLHKRIATFFRGRIVLGTPMVSRYASVSITTLGNSFSTASATRFTRTSWLAMSVPPSAARSGLHVGQWQIWSPALSFLETETISVVGLLRRAASTFSVTIRATSAFVGHSCAA